MKGDKRINDNIKIMVMPTVTDTLRSPRFYKLAGGVPGATLK
jgi:hypothetical protein